MKKSAAFTLVELLVVIAIIGILVSLLLPAVQSARETGRRVECSNHLRQMAIAIYAHASTYGYWPDGGEGYWVPRSKAASGIPDVAPRQYWGWPYQILPYLEMQALWDQPVDAKVYGTPVPLYNCPSRRRPMIVRTGFRGNETRYMMDYAGNAGTDPFFISGTDPNGFGADTDDGWGMMGNGRDAPLIRRPNGSAVRNKASITDASITDGLTNTLLLGEKCLNAGKLGQSQTDDDSGWIDGWDWDYMRWGYVQPQADFRDSSEPWFDPPHDNYIPFHTAFGSPHVGSFNGAMCDGSVRPISLNVSIDVFRRLSSRNDGQPLSSNEY